MSRTSGNSQPVDSVLFASVLFLLGLGIVMVYSSSAIMAYKTYGNSAHFLIRSLIYATGGLAIMIVISRVPSWVWSKASKYLLVFSIILLVLTLIFGTKAKGATRWIRIAGFSFQPTELAKVAYIIFLAKSLSKLSKNGFRGEKMIRNLKKKF